MSQQRKDSICALLKGIETGDPKAAAVVNPHQYIQHNPQTREGGEGLTALFKRLSKTSPRVNMVRVFSDGDFVFAHTEYEFSTSRVGFEVFRFEGDYTVEHWDNIQARKGPNPSAHSMVDGEVRITDPHLTESNRQLVSSFVEHVLIKRKLDSLADYVDGEYYTEHNPRMTDGCTALFTALSSKSGDNSFAIEYKKSHRILADANFVLCVSEGSLEGDHSSFYDLFRVHAGKIVEHWDTTEKIAPRSEWLNNNGKF